MTGAADNIVEDLSLLLLGLVVLARQGEDPGGVVVRSGDHGSVAANPVLDAGLVDATRDVILKDLARREGGNGEAEVLLCVAWTLRFQM